MDREVVVYMRYRFVSGTAQQVVETLLFEDDLADAEIGPAFAQVVGEDGFVPGQLAFDKVGADIPVGQGGVL